MIHKTDDGSYVISSGQVWVSGVFEDARTANYAFRFKNAELEKLQEKKNETTHTITFKDLQELRKNNKDVLHNKEDK